MKIGRKGRNRSGGAKIDFGDVWTPKRARNGVGNNEIHEKREKWAENGIKTGDLAGKQEISGKQDGTGRELRNSRKREKWA